MNMTNTYAPISTTPTVGLRLERTFKQHTMTPTENVALTQFAETMGTTTSQLLGQPFDLARSFYALTVRLGMIESSLLASARFGRDINSLEKMTLGPWARQV